MLPDLISLPNKVMGATGGMGGILTKLSIKHPTYQPISAIKSRLSRPLITLQRHQNDPQVILEGRFSIIYK